MVLQDLYGFALILPEQLLALNLHFNHSSHYLPVYPGVPLGRILGPLATLFDFNLFS